MSTSYPLYLTSNSLTVTNLASLVASTTVGWQSQLVTNTGATACSDYEILVRLVTSLSNGAGSYAAYVYVAPAYWDGVTWYFTDVGTGTVVSGTEGTCTIIGGSSSNSLYPLGILNYSQTNMVMQKTMFLSNALGGNMPDGFSLIVINDAGIVLGTSAHKVAYRGIQQTIV